MYLESLHKLPSNILCFSFAEKLVHMQIREEISTRRQFKKNVQIGTGGVKAVNRIDVGLLNCQCISCL